MTPVRELDIAHRRRGRTKRIKADDLHQEWMENSAYRREHEALEEEFSLVAALLQARSLAGLTQARVARRMKTTQTAISCLAGGWVNLSTRTLEYYAAARLRPRPARAAPRPVRHQQSDLTHPVAHRREHDDDQEPEHPRAWTTHAIPRRGAP